MGLETRGGRMYFYRKERRDGRPVSVYCGSPGNDEGRLWLSLARIDHSRRVQEAADRARAMAPIAQLRAGEVEARELAEQARELAALALLAAGYHSHKGTWRKRRGDAVKRAATAEKAPELPPLPAPDDDSRAARLAIMSRCNRADASPEDVAAMRRLLGRAPHLIDSLGNIMRNALEGATVVAQGTPIWTTSSDVYIAQRRKALGYDEAPPLERPLIDHLLLCEVRMGHMELRYTAAWKDSMTWKATEAWEGLLSSAQRRYLAAVETLAKVRRVRVEVLQVTGAAGETARGLAVERPGG